MSLGFTLPLDGHDLASHRPILRELVDRGYTDAWAGEADGLDAVVPLAAAAAWEPELRVGTGIVPVFTRGPAVLAMTAAAMGELAPGRWSLGLGASSPVVVQDWNGVPHAQPLARTRDVLRFVRRALAGDRISEDLETFSVRGFRLSRPVATPPPILLAALRPRMLRLAGEEADGAIVTWIPPDQVSKVAGELQAASPTDTPRRLVAWVTVCPDDDADRVRDRARPAIAAYLNVPAYEQLHRWLGNGPALEPMWAAWKAGERRRALAAIPDELIDRLVVHGPAAACRERLEAYLSGGVTDLALAVQPGSPDPVGALRALAPERA